MLSLIDLNQRVSIQPEHECPSGVAVLQVSPCPRECRCSAAVPRCAAGVSLASDDCGCCMVCGRQLNENCGRMQPCDRTKGLKCNFGAAYGAAYGICRGMYVTPP